jgi:hypothetical protein
MPTISRGSPTARPISSLIQPIASSSVPISGPGTYSVRLAIAAAKARISGEGPNQPLFVGQRHFGVGKDHRFAAPVRQTGRGILKGHCSRQSEGFLGADIGRHPNPADRRPASDIVDRDHRLETNPRPVHLNDLEWSEIVSKPKRVSHPSRSFHCGLSCSLSTIVAYVWLVRQRDC